ncbi:sugar transferase [Alteraurantiacibacter buctensis]|uniref:Sugar transferase n=1 Tax=Alteraurantiacibacter buctensis TaxID=1503981 RepID=A0A844YXB5_9SPHN|nr:sugar transferase [Alteraurantiacibacter buctensis]MXO71618.1 sugar transferase [Alteraurantiacibacter buctensis]
MRQMDMQPGGGGSAYSEVLAGRGHSAIGRRTLLERYTFILPLMVLFVLAGQTLVALTMLSVPLGHRDVINGYIAAVPVNVLAALILREFRRTPGTSRFAFILPSFALPVLAMLAVLVGLRIPYSNYMLVGGVGSALAFLYLISAFQRPTSGRRIYLVPGGEIAQLQEDMGWLNVEVLRSPADLARCGDGAVVADLRHELSSEWERGIARATINGVPVYNAKQVRESLTGRVQIESLSENSFGALIPSLSYLLVKRVIDLVGALVLLAVLAIPLVAIALVIRADSPGPALYRHRRVGYRGRPFDTIKFRTMHARVQDDEDLESQKTLDNDPRVTAVGRTLRKMRLDELPQLINVVRGEMSLIGPRPEAQALSRWYDEHLDFYDYRHIVRPGITGWAQVNQGHVTELDDVYIKLQYDFYYIKNVSAWLDLLIALRTLGVMINFRGAK